MDIKTILNSVADFHTAFNVPVNNAPTVDIDPKTVNLRKDLMNEEVDEYVEACNDKDVVEVLDAVVDQLYILAGTIVTHGLQNFIVPAFKEVHRSNMSKLDADGKPIFREDGKVLKSELYSKPDLKQFLQ